MIFFTSNTTNRKKCIYILYIIIDINRTQCVIQVATVPFGYFKLSITFEPNFNSKNSL